MAARKNVDPRSGTKSNLRAVPPPEFENFDDIRAEATKGMRPYKLRISDDEILTIECPSQDDMDALKLAGLAQDSNAMAVAVFSEEHAVRILELAGPEPFPVMGKLVERVMTHYGLEGENLPE